MIGVYGMAGCFNPTCLAGNDNDESCLHSGAGASRVSFDSEQGKVYLFAVGNRNGRLDGDFGLVVSEETDNESDKTI